MSRNNDGGGNGLFWIIVFLIWLFSVDDETTVTVTGTDPDTTVTTSEIIPLDTTTVIAEKPFGWEQDTVVTEPDTSRWGW